MCFAFFIGDKNGTLIEFNGEPDHVHLLFEVPPQVELSKLVNTLKTVSSRLVRKKHSEYLKKYYWNLFFGAEVIVF